MEAKMHHKFNNKKQKQIKCNYYNLKKREKIKALGAV